MAVSIFTTMARAAERAGIFPYTQKAREWYIRKHRGMHRIPSKRLLQDNTLIKRKKPLVGRMFMFTYDPKHKLTLPYYDRFPLIIMVGPAKGGFFGLNLHYLPTKARAVFFDRLTETLNNVDMDESTRFEISYQMLKSASRLRAFAPCFKHYLFDHLTSSPMEVPSSEWEVALFIPSHDFAKEDTRKIWDKSRNLANI